jgi:hypothetical protein
MSGPMSFAGRSTNLEAFTRSARELAGERRHAIRVATWDRRPRIVVGRVRAAVRNETARVSSVKSIAVVIAAVAAALDEAGRSGITPIKGEPSEVLYGWWVEFYWLNLPSTTP